MSADQESVDKASAEASADQDQSVDKASADQVLEAKQKKSTESDLEDDHFYPNI